MAELDAFDGNWLRAGSTEVPMARVRQCDVVPISSGHVAFLLLTAVNPRPEFGSRMQVVMSPDYARRVAELLITAANKVSPPN